MDFLSSHCLSFSCLFYSLLLNFYYVLNEIYMTRNAEKIKPSTLSSTWNALGSESGGDGRNHILRSKTVHPLDTFSHGKQKKIFKWVLMCQKLQKMVYGGTEKCGKPFLLL